MIADIDCLRDLKLFELNIFLLEYADFYTSYKSAGFRKSEIRFRFGQLIYQNSYIAGTHKKCDQLLQCSLAFEFFLF